MRCSVVKSSPPLKSYESYTSQGMNCRSFGAALIQIARTGCILIIQILAIMRALVDECMSLEIDVQPVPVLLNPRSSAAAKLEGQLLSQQGRGSANVRSAESSRQARNMSKLDRHGSKALHGLFSHASTDYCCAAPRASADLESVDRHASGSLRVPESVQRPSNVTKTLTRAGYMP